MSDKLRDAFIEADLRTLGATSNDDFYWTASERFEIKMQRLVKKRQKPLWNCVNTAGKRVASVTIAFVLMFTLSLSVEAVRSSLLELIIQIGEDFSNVYVDNSSDSDLPQIIEEKYLPTYIPEGYEVSKVEDNVNILRYEYINSEGNFIEYNQAPIVGSSFGVNTEDSELVPILINGCEGFYCETKTNANVVFWNTDEYMFFIIADNVVSLDELIIIAESIEHE